MGGEDYGWVQGGKLRPGMLVLDIRGLARDGSVPEGVGVVEEITDITPASPSGGKEYVKLYLKEVKRGTERTRYVCKTKLFSAKAKTDPFRFVGGTGSGLCGSKKRLLRPPHAADLEEPRETRRSRTEIYRIIRDTTLTRAIKTLHENRCQICGMALRSADGSPYAEAHHIKPLGRDHNGPDIASNILVLCPNHHALCDMGAIRLDLESIRTHPEHTVGNQFVDYHNHRIAGN